jgi:hypothetical protein
MKLFITLIFFLLSLQLFASPTPFKPHVWNKFVEFDAENVVKSKKFIFDASKVTASSGSTHELGLLPKEARILKSYMYVESVLVSASSNTFGLNCATDSDIFLASDNILSVATGNMQNGAANFPNTATATLVDTGSTGCTLTAAIGSGASGITAGLLQIIIEYFKY